MNDKLSSNGLKAIVIAAIVVGLGIAGGSFYAVQKAKIDADRAIKETEIHEKEATERTEERSQFWQKLIPWGRDEAEKND